MVGSKYYLLAAFAVVATCGQTTADTVNPFRVAEQAPAAEVVDTPDPIDPDRRSMDQLKVDIELPSGKLPAGIAKEVPSTAALAGDLPRPWPTQVYHWQAAATWHQPLYFEEINAERYGYSCNWVCQPFVSTAHFFATIPALPYLKASDCPWECEYTLGHYRPGSCPPYRFHCWPVDGLGALAEGGTAAWLVLVLP